jgi:hypothetical protein
MTAAQPSLTSGNGALLPRPRRMADAATSQAAYQDPLISGPARVRIADAPDIPESQGNVGRSR